MYFNGHITVLGIMKASNKMIKFLRDFVHGFGSLKRGRVVKVKVLGVEYNGTQVTTTQE